ASTHSPWNMPTDAPATQSSITRILPRVATPGSRSTWKAPSAPRPVSSSATVTRIALPHPSDRFASAAAVAPTDAMVRMAPRLARSLPGAAVSVLLFACTPDEPGTVVRDDDKVRYVVHGDAKVSEAAIDRVVAQIAELSALFGVEPKKVEYHFFESRERLDDGNTCNVETPAEGV